MLNLTLVQASYQTDSEKEETMRKGHRKAKGHRKGHRRGHKREK